MIVDCAVYEGGRRHPGKVDLDESFDPSRDGFVWIDLAEPSPEEFDRVRREFDLHDLAVEDALRPHQRPKVEAYGDTLFVVFKTARYIDTNEVVELGEVMLFIGAGFVVVVRRGPGCDLADIRQWAENHPDLLEHGPGAVLYAIVDRIVDDYAPVVEGVDQDIQQVEAAVFSPEQTAPVERIYYLKREVLEFHAAIEPLAESLDGLASGRISSVAAGALPDHLGTYFRDVHDHLLRIVARVGNHRDLLTNVLTANLTLVGIQQNQDMRKISAWVAIAAVPTAIAGIYGMNFDHMPELRSTFGYPAVLLVILLACLYLYRRFRRSGWL